MANSIDWGTLALGALVGVGCRKQLRAATRIAANTAASLAGATAQAVAAVAQEANKSPEQVAAQQFCARVDQQINQQLAGSPLSGQAPQANQNPNG